MRFQRGAGTVRTPTGGATVVGPTSRLVAPEGWVTTGTAVSATGASTVSWRDLTAIVTLVAVAATVLRPG